MEQSPESSARSSFNPNWIAVIGAIIILSLFGYLGLKLSERPGCNNENNECLRILFVGNSFTETNNLPDVFARLAKSGGHQVDAQMMAKGGWSLEQHAASVQSVSSIQSQQWDVVVLQEQSQIPSIHRGRAYSMYPAVKALTTIITEQKSSAMLMQTWAHQGGWPDQGMPDFESMQAEIDTGYQEISSIFRIPVVPVGDAWFTEWKRNPQVKLWQNDGIHPTEQGTYLAACVFYAALFHETPLGLHFIGNLSNEEAQELQSVAGMVVLGSAQR